MIDPVAIQRELDAFWARRDDPETIRRTEAKFAEAGPLANEDAGLLWRAARWHFWKADTSDDPKVRRNLAKIGWDLAERALQKQPDSLDAHYWAAVSVGTYGDALGIVKALSEGIEGKFRGHLDLMVQKSPGYEAGGPLLTLGRYYATLPWPKRDRTKAVETLRSAIAKNPRNLRARVYLAEVLVEMGDDEAKEALQLVEEVLAAKPGAYDAPEERHAQKLARAAKVRIEKELK